MKRRTILTFPPRKTFVKSRKRPSLSVRTIKRPTAGTDELKSYMHVALVLDASGSMGSLRRTTIASLKKFFDGLKSKEDKTLLDVWQFDDEVKHLVDSVDINVRSPQTLENYAIGGCTALYDAICIGIDELGRKLAAMPEAERPDGVIFAILTDGFENASRLFTQEEVRGRIEHQSAKYSWEFRFLAANQDAIATGRDFGLAAESCTTFAATGCGVRKVMCSRHSPLVSGAAVMRKMARHRRALRNMTSF